MQRALPPEIRLKVAWEIAFSPAEDRIAYFGGRDIVVLDLPTRTPLFTVHPIANPSHIDFSPDGNHLAAKSTSGRTVVLDAKTGAMLSDFRNQKEGEGEKALFSNCGRFVVSVSWAGMFGVREWKSKELVFSRVHTGCQIRHLSVTADRRSFVYSLLSASSPYSSEVTWSVVRQQWPAEGQAVCEISRRWSDIYGLQISPTGRFLAIVHGTPPKTLEIYDLERSCVTARHTSSFGGIAGCSIGWSNDEKTLILNGRDHQGEGKCQVLDLPNLNVRYEFGMEYPTFFKYSPSGRFLALGSAKRGLVVATADLDAFARSRRTDA